MPLQLQSIIQDRIDNLATVPRRCLQTAAVFGRLFRSDVLAAMLSDVPSIEYSLEQLTDQGFIRLDRHRPAAEYTFRHVLVQEAVYQGLTGQQRQAMHSLAGDALERIYAQHLEPYVEEIARHHELGSEPMKAIPYLLLSGKKAQGVYLNEMALAYYRRAQTLCENHDDVAIDQKCRLAILRGIGECLAALGKSEEAEAMLRRAIQLAASLERPVSEQVRCYFPLCQLLRWLGRFDDLLHLGQEGMALLGDDSESPEAVMLIAYLASASYLTGKRRRYRSLVALTIDALRDMEYGAHLVTAYGTAAWWYRDAKRSTEGRIWLDPLLREAERRNDQWTLGHLYATPGYWLPEADGDWATVWSNIEQVSVLAERTGDPVLRAYAYTYLGHLNWLAGILDTARVMYTKALAIPFQNQISQLHVLSRAGSGWVMLAQGDVAGAITALEQAVDDAAVLRYRVHGMQMARLSLARAYTIVGRGQEAISLYRLVVVEDEADSDGQMWIASALAGLEHLQTVSSDFQMSCRHIACQRNADDPLHLVQWQLTEWEESLSMIAREIRDTCGLRHSWQWFDPYEDCSCAVDEIGVTIWAANHYRDIWLCNSSAPRLLRPVQGDFAIEASCRLFASDRPALGGLLLWASESNFLRLDWNIDGPGSVSLRGSIDNQDRLLGRGLLPVVDEVVLRIERHGECVRALCSPGGQRWYRVAEIRFPMIDPTFVGPFASGAISRWFYCGAFAEGTVIRFENIRLFEIAQ